MDTSNAPTDERGRPVLEPGPDHPITVEPAGSRVSVGLAGVTVAESDRALALREAGYPTVLYLPLADVDRALLRESQRTTYCPFKGDATYWSVEAGGEAAVDAVWGYPDARPAVGAIADHVAFYPDPITVTSAAPVE